MARNINEWLGRHSIRTMRFRDGVCACVRAGEWEVQPEYSRALGSCCQMGMMHNVAQVVREHDASIARLREDAQGCVVRL